MFVLVHPIDAAADALWRRFGFSPAPTEEPMLILPINDLTNHVQVAHPDEAGGA